MHRLPVAFAPLLVLALACVLPTRPALARNVVYHLSIQDVLASADYRTHVGNDIAFSFGGHHAPAGTKELQDFVVAGKARISGGTDQRACAEAMVKALAELHTKVSIMGGNAAIGVISYDRRVAFSSDTEYECHAGSHSVRVTLQATAASFGH